MNSIIHDLKAPINSVVMLMGVIKLKINEPTMLNLIQQTSDKAKQLVADIESILIAASGGNRKIILNPKEVNIAELVEIAKSDVDILYKEKKHQIIIDDQTNGKAIAKADRMYMLNVIRNLIENAVKYADEGVKVKISIYMSLDKALTVSISDNGWGISHKDQKLIFQQYYRVPHENAPKGHGIGLALVKYVVEAHGKHMTDTKNKIKALIIDDDVTLGAILSTGLQLLNIETIYQTSLAGLQSVVKSSRPNIIILDVEVGESNSIDLIQQLKLYAEGIPVIFMSSHIDAGYQTKAINEGAIAFLKKPVDVEEVAAYIKRFGQKEQQQDTTSTVTIGCYTFNLQSRVLIKKGENSGHLTAKQSQVIKLLLEHTGEVVPRQDIKQALWPDGNASDASLDNYISQLRKIFAEDKKVQIITIPKIGFKLKIS